MNPSETDEQEQEAEWKYVPASNTNGYEGGRINQTEGVPLPTIPEVTWTASEYIAHEKAPSWYVALFGGSLVLVGFIYLITRDLVASIVVFIACLILGVYAGRKPETKQYVVSEQGVGVGEKSYSYGEFRSFSVVEEGAIDSIWLKPLKRFAPVVIMYFAPEDEEKIINVLANFLPHEQRELDVVDRLSKRIRF